MELYSVYSRILDMGGIYSKNKGEKHSIFTNTSTRANYHMITGLRLQTGFKPPMEVDWLKVN